MKLAEGFGTWGLKMSRVNPSALQWSTELAYLLLWILLWKTRRRRCLRFNLSMKEGRGLMMVNEDRNM